MPVLTKTRLTAPNCWEITYRTDSWITFKMHVILPADHETSPANKKYPLILFGHGTGEAGSSLASIYNSTAGGPAYFNTKGKWGPVINPIDKKAYEFIVITPQAGSYSPSLSIMLEVLAWAVATYKVDTGSMHWVGISAAGTAMLAYNNMVNPPFKFASYVVMAVVTGGYNINNGKKIAADNTKWWGLYDLSDGNGIQTQNWKKAIDDNKKGLTKETLHNDEHGGWYRLDPTWKENELSVYEWALQFRSDSAIVVPEEPTIPTVPTQPKELAKLTIATASGNLTVTVFDNKTAIVS